ncbi:MAG: discoidin domain-containing protein [Clostridia bacterium]|nr:discoidin domain-containing protein [Clostridia bacterium]
MNIKRVSFILAIALLLSVFSVAIPSVSLTAVADSDPIVYESHFENFSMNVGSDETERNFIWHSDSKIGYVDFAVRNGNTFPSEYTTVSTRLSKFNGKMVHRATILGLEYDTEYVYRLRSGDYVSELRYFSTDPIDKFNFIYVGDPQMGAGSLANNIANWKNTMNLATRMFPETSLLVSAGDQVEISTHPEFFAAFLEPDQLSSLAIATSIGNHDYDSNYYKNYFNNPNDTTDGKIYGNTKAGGNYWYTYNNVLFMHVNSCNISWAEHKEFMEKAIAANPDVTWKVVVTHYNFFGSNNYFINEAIKERREAFAPIIKELDIDVVLSGHEHVNSRAYMIDGLDYDKNQGNATSVTDPVGTLYFSGGTPSGSKFYKLLSDAELPHIAFKLQDTITFTNIEVDGDSFKTTTYRVSDGAVLDTFEIVKTKNVTDPLNVDVADEKTYTTTGSVSSSYPNKNNKLTDGADDSFVGFTGTSSEVTVNLGEVKNVDRFVANVGTSKAVSTAKAPKTVTVSVSENGTSFTTVGTVSVTDDTSKSVIPVQLKLDKAVKAKYVKFTFTASGSLTLVSELDVFEEHIHDEVEWSDIYAPTYHFDGLKVKRCSSCGTAYEYEYVSKLVREEGNNNVALGKKYEHSDLITSDGSEKYPDEDGTTMTDSLLASETGKYNDAAYIGFHSNYGDYSLKGYFHITVDLEECYHLDKFVTYTASKYATAGVTGPKTVSVYVSEDGKAWVHAGTVNPTDTDETSMLEIVIEPETVLYGRYVQFRYVPSNAFVMVAEVEAHEAAIETHDHVAGEWIRAQEPTLTEKGKNIKTCTVCGITVETEDIPELDSSVYGKNLVFGKTYERSSLYVSGGKDKYPDENGKSMTDGQIAPDNSYYSNVAYMAFYVKNQDYIDNKYFHITFDLGRTYELWRFTTDYASSSASNHGAGVQEPANVSIYVSSDNKNWTYVDGENPPDTTDKGRASTDIILSIPVNARYVQFRYTAKSTFVMVSETEVYGFAPEGDAYMVGDINNNGEIEKYDYILVKRSVMGTVTLDDLQKAAADVNGKDGVEKYDYILIKRHVMGTYKIA